MSGDYYSDHSASEIEQEEREIDPYLSCTNKVKETEDYNTNISYLENRESKSIQVEYVKQVMVQEPITKPQP